MILAKTTDLFGDSSIIPIQGLTWKPPFGSLMLHGKIETRTWPTRHRGKVLICQGQTKYSQEEMQEMCNPAQLEGIAKLITNFPEDFTHFGYAIAIGVLAQCRPMRVADEEKAFVMYKPNLYSHVYENVQRIKPLKIKGGQKWISVKDQNFLSQIEFI